jgi:hypothetical protein
VKKSRTEKCKCSSAGQTTAKSKTPKPVTEKETSTTGSGSVLSTTKKSLELVEWRDAHFAKDDADDWPEDYVNATVGWIEEEDKWLKISSELTLDGERAVTRVPLVNVVSRRLLEIGPSQLISITWDARMD